MMWQLRNFCLKKSEFAFIIKSFKRIIAKVEIRSQKLTGILNLNRKAATHRALHHTNSWLDLFIWIASIQERSTKEKQMRQKSTELNLIRASKTWLLTACSHKNQVAAYDELQY